jgi:hypothetical protein
MEKSGSSSREQEETLFIIRSFVKRFLVRPVPGIKWRDIDEGMRKVVLEEMESSISIYSPPDLANMFLG